MHTEPETLREDGPGGRGGTDGTAGPGLVATARREDEAEMPSESPPGSAGTWLSGFWPPRASGHNPLWLKVAQCVVLCDSNSRTLERSPRALWRSLLVSSTASGRTPVLPRRQ